VHDSSTLLRNIGKGIDMLIDIIELRGEKLVREKGLNIMG
jgi:hypothetical protein